MFIGPTGFSVKGNISRRCRNMYMHRRTKKLMTIQPIINVYVKASLISSGGVFKPVSNFSKNRFLFLRIKWNLYSTKRLL